MGFTVAITVLISLSISLALTRSLIFLMNSRGVGQYIRSWGPKVHEHKSGTPTMGGLAILAGLGFGLLYLWFSLPGGRNNLILIITGTFGFGAIGLLDDVLSLIKGKAEGLSPGGKIFAQLVMALILIFLVFQLLDNPTRLLIPFSPTPLTLHPGFYWSLVLFIILGTVNAVNLTDGIDGLAAGASFITISTFGLFCGSSTLPLVAAILGAIIGFLWYNSYPAEIFMGDTGAFALGGFIVALSAVVRGEIFLPFLGGLFFLECCSVLIQVTYYKTTGSRIFKMTPLHHHFETAEGIEYTYLLPEVEWSEPRVAARLLMIHLIIAGVGLAGYYLI